MYSKELKKEISKYIKKYELTCKVEDLKDFKGTRDSFRFWDSISYNEDLSEEFLYEFKDIFDKISWERICEEQQMSEEFILKMMNETNYISLIHIFANNRLSLSEKFIRKYAKDDYNYWDEISTNCRMSDDFIDKNKNKINWEFLMDNSNITMKTLIRFKKYIDWDYIFGSPECFALKLIQQFTKTLEISDIK